MVKNIFVPHYLKTIQVDTEKKIFKVNGEDFGNGCTSFLISCDGPGKFSIRMDLDAVIRFVHYEKNKIVSDVTTAPYSGSFTDNLQESGD